MDNFTLPYPKVLMCSCICMFSKVHSVIHNLSGKQWQPVVYTKKSFISLKLVLLTFNVVSCHAKNLVATLWGLPAAINRKLVSVSVTYCSAVCITFATLWYCLHGTVFSSFGTALSHWD